MRYLLVLSGIFVLALGGCERGKKIIPPEEHTYQVEGVVVRDLNKGMDIAWVLVERDSVPFPGALVKVNNHELGGMDTTGTYYLERPGLFTPLSPCSLFVFSEPDSYTVQAVAVMPGDFRITSLWPKPYYVYNPASRPRVEWSISDSARGYFVSVVGVGEAQGARGLAKKIPPQDQGATSIEVETFWREGTTDPLPGPYVVWVVAYNRSFVGYYDIPFQLPAGLPEGTFGAGVIAVTDTIWVTTGE